MVNPSVSHWLALAYCSMRPCLRLGVRRLWLAPRPGLGSVPLGDRNGQRPAAPARWAATKGSDKKRPGPQNHTRPLHNASPCPLNPTPSGKTSLAPVVHTMKAIDQGY